MAKKKVARSKRVTKKPAKKKTTPVKAVKKPSKKSTKKPAASKKSTKKTMAKSVKSMSTSRQRVYNLTREVPEYHYFVLANGQPVKHVAELASILDQLEDHVFQHHVTAEKNDFHNWIRDVFEDVELAKKVSGATDKRRLQLIIYKHMAGHDD